MILIQFTPFRWRKVMLIQMIKAAIRNQKKRVTKNTESSLSCESDQVSQVVSLMPQAGRRLHIGGHEFNEYWEIFDAQPRIGVDHVGDASDLSRFPSETFVAVYASHVLEHFEYYRVVHVLSEWNRVLVSGGLLYVSVPDLDVLSAFILDKRNSTFQHRFDVIRMLFGGQTDNYDFHKVGINEEVMFYFLRQAGFDRMQRVYSFGFFSDTSNLVFLKKSVSLNVVAFKP